MFSGAIDPSPRVNAGSTPLQPTTRAEFRAHHGKKSAAQRWLGGWGRQMDQAQKPYISKPAPRYQPHNCLPWRSDNCISCFPLSSVPEHLAREVWSPTEQQQPLSPAATSMRGVLNGTPDSMQWQANKPNLLSTVGWTPTHPPGAQWWSVPPGPQVIRDQVPAQNLPSAQWQPMTNPTSSGPKTVAAVVERIQHLLLQYFCDGGGAEATEGQRRDKAEEILKAQFQAPVILNMEQPDIGHCEEFSTIKKAVESCLEVLHVDGLRVVPELSDNGRELVVHIGH